MKLGGVGAFKIIWANRGQWQRQLMLHSRLPSMTGGFHEMSTQQGPTVGFRYSLVGRSTNHHWCSTLHSLVNRHSSAGSWYQQPPKFQEKIVFQALWQGYVCIAKVPRGKRKRKPFPAAISYGSDFLPPVKNSRCGIVSHAAATGIGGGIQTEHLSVSMPTVPHRQETVEKNRLNWNSWSKRSLIKLISNSWLTRSLNGTKFHYPLRNSPELDNTTKKLK